MTEVHNFGVDAISCHAWNKDKTGTNEKPVYPQRDGSNDRFTSSLFFYAKVALAWFQFVKYAIFSVMLFLFYNSIIPQFRA